MAFTTAHFTKQKTKEIVNVSDEIVDFFVVVVLFVHFSINYN